MPNFFADGDAAFGYSQPATWNFKTEGATPSGPAVYNTPSSGIKWGSVGSLAGKALPFAMLMASNYIQGQQAQKTARQTAQANQQTWQQNAYPQQAYLDAQAAQNRGELAQARLGSYQNLASNLATRGWGPGSGLMRGGAQTIESNYLKGLGKQASDITKLGATPMFGMPSQAYQQPVAGGTQSALDSMDAALGRMAAMDYAKRIGLTGYFL